MKLYNYVVKRELAILKTILSELQLNASRNCSDVVKFRETGFSMLSAAQSDRIMFSHGNQDNDFTPTAR